MADTPDTTTTTDTADASATVERTAARDRAQGCRRRRPPRLRPHRHQRADLRHLVGVADRCAERADRPAGLPPFLVDLAAVVARRAHAGVGRGAVIRLADG